MTEHAGTDGNNLLDGGVFALPTRPSPAPAAATPPPVQASADVSVNDQLVDISSRIRRMANRVDELASDTSMSVQERREAAILLLAREWAQLPVQNLGA